MKIELRSETDISGWSGFFKLFNNNQQIMLWKILDIPEAFISYPKTLIEISNEFLERETGVSDLFSLPETELSSYQESVRLIHLGYLYRAFGKITFAYGENNSRALYNLADRNFIHKKSTFWWQWYHLLNYEIKNALSLAKNLGETEYIKILEIINFNIKAFKKKIYAARRIISKNGEIEISVENFELILDQECAYQTWMNINKLFDEKTRRQIFEWGYDKAKSLGGVGNWKNTKLYCLSV